MQKTVYSRWISKQYERTVQFFFVWRFYLLIACTLLVACSFDVWKWSCWRRTFQKGWDDVPLPLVRDAGIKQEKNW